MGRMLAGLGIVDNDGIVKGDKDVYKRFTVSSMLSTSSSSG